MMAEQQPSAADEHRVQFDFEIDFSNGGGIAGQGFRLEIDGDDISDEELVPRQARRAKCMRTCWGTHGELVPQALAAPAASCRDWAA